MEGVKNLPKKLPDSRNDFDIDVVGEMTGQSFKGEFTCKIPTLRDNALIAKHRAALNGDFAQFLDLSTLKLHQMISYLRYTLEKAPKFWRESDNGYELLDMNVVEAVYDKALEFEESWMKQIWGEEKIEALKQQVNGEPNKSNE